MSRKTNIKKETFQPTTECINSLAIDGIAGQAVPESGTSHMECSVAALSVPPVDVSVLIGADAC